MSLRASRKRLGVHAEDVTGETKAGPCQLCGEHADPLHFDHGHATTRFRGWLCQPCNKGLGHFKDNPALLRAAADYVEAACSPR